MYYSFSPSPPSTSYTTTPPMEIPGSSNARSQSPSCAFPSWPRRSSLSSNASDEDAYSSSFIISDEELFPSVFDDLEHDTTPPPTPHTNRSPASPSRVCEMVVDNGTLMRDLLVQEKSKKEQRSRRKSTGSRKSRSSSGGKHMSPILEVGE